VTFELSSAVFVGQGNGSFYQPLHFGAARNLDVLVGHGADRPSVSVLLNLTR